VEGKKEEAGEEESLSALVFAASFSTIAIFPFICFLFFGVACYSNRM